MSCRKRTCKHIVVAAASGPIFGSQVPLIFLMTARQITLIAEDPQTGRGLPVGHAIVSSVNTATTAAFIEALWRYSPSVSAPAVVLTDMDNALISGCFDAFCLRLQMARPPASRWCIFHVYRAWFGRVAGIGGDEHRYNPRELEAGLKLLARASTAEEYDARLADLRTRFCHATIPAGATRSGNRQSFWQYFDTYFHRHKVRRVLLHLSPQA